jgi:hypothetical protein
MLKVVRYVVKSAIKYPLPEKFQKFSSDPLIVTQKTASFIDLAYFF